MVLEKGDKEELRIFFLAILVGVLAGISSIFYRVLISFASKFISFFVIGIRQNYIYIIALVFFLVILSFISAFMTRERYALGSGIPQVVAEIEDYIETNPLKVIIYKVFGGFCAALGGLSIGREGPSIQLGAMSGKLIANIFKVDKKMMKHLLTCGASAGLAAAFNAPLAGIVFAIEEVHRKFNKKLVIACFTAATVANLLSRLYFGKEEVFEFHEFSYMDIRMYVHLVIIGIILGLLGAVYMFVMKTFHNTYEKIGIKNKFRPLVAYLFSFIMFLFFPYVLGSGHDLVEDLISNKYTLAFLIILLIIKMLFSILSFTSSVAGGIFLPILVQGAIFGCIYSSIFAKEYLAFVIILSMAAYLTAIVRSPITAIILLFEMTGKVSYFLPLVLVCLMSYLVANLLNIKPVYDYLLGRLIYSEKVQNKN